MVLVEHPRELGPRRQLEAATAQERARALRLDPGHDQSRAGRVGLDPGTADELEILGLRVRGVGDDQPLANVIGNGRLVDRRRDHDGRGVARRQLRQRLFAQDQQHPRAGELAPLDRVQDRVPRAGPVEPSRRVEPDRGRKPRHVDQQRRRRARQDQRARAVPPQRLAERPADRDRLDEVVDRVGAPQPVRQPDMGGDRRH